jgi:hypothetical protein
MFKGLVRNSARLRNTCAMAKSKKKFPESCTGLFAATPHEVLDSVAFMGASARAKAMLFELVRQHNGRNNGHLQLAISHLRRRGWTSTDQAQKAKEELIERELIVKTRLGGLGMGPDLYAVTWLPVTDLTGLHVRRDEFLRGGWRRLDPPQPLIKRKLPSMKLDGVVSNDANGEAPAAPRLLRKSGRRIVGVKREDRFLNRQQHLQKQNCHTEGRDEAVPHGGNGNAPAGPQDGAKTGQIEENAVPPDGNNVCIPFPALNVG